MKVVLLLLGIFIASVVKCQVLEGVVSDAEGQAVFMYGKRHKDVWPMKTGIFGLRCPPELMYVR